MAGIPVTHRGLASAFVVVRGHAPAAYGPVLSNLPPGAATVVVLMGLAHRCAIAELLVARGWKASTPAAVVQGATHLEQTSWTGTLGRLGEAVADGSESAGVLVIGEVVSLASALNASATANQERWALST